MLRINVQQNAESVTVKLAGKIGRSSVVQLNRAWIESATLLPSAPHLIDLRDVTQADGCGVKALRDIQTLAGARLITSSPLTKYIAENIVRRCASRTGQPAKRNAAIRSRFQPRNGRI